MGFRVKLLFSTVAFLCISFFALENKNLSIYFKSGQQSSTERKVGIKSTWLTSLFNLHTRRKQHVSHHKIAIVRPFSAKETGSLVSSFDVWEKFLPCNYESSIAPNVEIDLFLSFSQTYENNTDARKATNDVLKQLRSSKWGKCFNALHSIEAGIPPEEDLYEPSLSQTNIMWVNGPNRQFGAAFRAIFGHPEYDYFYLMESDSIPVKKYWLDTLIQEINEMNPFAILGSKYDGDSWDEFKDQLPISLVNHINGNAIYSMKHPLLLRMVRQLQQEATSVYNSIPYDYRISQIVYEGSDGILPEIETSILKKELENNKDFLISSNTNKFLKWWQKYGKENPMKESKTISNFAATNLLPRHLNNASIIHGASHFSPFDETKHDITLIISEWYDRHSSYLLSEIDSSHHPFSKITLVLPADLHNDNYPDVETTLPVTFHHRSSPDFMDVCEAPVSTEWFMITNAYHSVKPHIDLLFTADTGKPVITYTPSNKLHCTQYKECKEIFERALEFDPNLNMVVLNSDILFKTSIRNEFCDAWKKKQLQEKRLYYKNDKLVFTNGQIGPTGTDYISYLSSEKKGDDIYKFSARTYHGGRDAFIKVFGAEEEMNGNSALLLERRMERRMQDIVGGAPTGGGGGGKPPPAPFTLFPSAPPTHSPTLLVVNLTSRNIDNETEEFSTLNVNISLRASIWNTFQDDESTNGLEIMYAFREATISNDTEFSLFPPNPPGTPDGGFYNIDITPDTISPLKGNITWTLKDNLGAGHLVLDEGSYDRYYVILEDAVASASLVRRSNLNPKVSVPSYEEKGEIADLFMTGLSFPPVLGNNVILLEVRPGANMTELEQVMIVEYTLLSSDESGQESVGTGVVSIVNTFEEVNGTGGLETIYWANEDIINNDVEFLLFPPNPPGTPEGGFYDIDISIDDEDTSKGTITWTLKDNRGAGHLVLDAGSFDRYYLFFDETLASASLVEGSNLNPKVSVPYYEQMDEIVDLFDSGLEFPSLLNDKIMLMEVQPGANMTQIDQIIRVDITFDRALNVTQVESSSNGTNATLNAILNATVVNLASNSTILFNETSTENILNNLTSTTSNSTTNSTSNFVSNSSLNSTLNSTSSTNETSVNLESSTNTNSTLNNASNSTSNITSNPNFNSTSSSPPPTSFVVPAPQPPTTVIVNTPVPSPSPTSFVIPAPIPPTTVIVNTPAPSPPPTLFVIPAPIPPTTVIVNTPAPSPPPTSFVIPAPLPPTTVIVNTPAPSPPPTLFVIPAPLPPTTVIVNTPAPSPFPTVPPTPVTSPFPTVGIRTAPVPSPTSPPTWSPTIPPVQIPTLLSGIGAPERPRTKLEVKENIMTYVVQPRQLPCRRYCYTVRSPWRTRNGGIQKCNWRFSCSGCPECEEEEDVV